jgi:DNA-binding XRE family transcriptional regulator
MRASLARDIIQDRERLGWSQAEPARRAGIRPETFNRIETGKHTASVVTIEKIDTAFRARPSRSLAGEIADRLFCLEL